MAFIPTENIIASIVATELGMQYLEPIVVNNTSSNFVTIYNTEFTIPNTKGLFCVIEFLNSKVFSNNRYIDYDDSGGITEYQSMDTRETIMIDLFSRDSSSRIKKNEVVMSLRSIFSEQQQDIFNFKIFPISEYFRNTSRAEGATMLNRFSITIDIARTYHKKIFHNPTSQYYYDNGYTVDGYTLPEQIKNNTPAFTFTLDS